MIGRIYKLEGNGLVYYGSTIETLKIRLYKHKSAYKKWLKDKYHYLTSFEIIKEEHTITLVEEGTFETIIQLKERERYYIENFDCVNNHTPNKTNKEWRDEHKEYQKEYNKNWRDENEEYKKQQDKVYYENNRQKILERIQKTYTCECGSTLRCNNKTNHLQSKKHQSFSSSP